MFEKPVFPVDFKCPPDRRTLLIQVKSNTDASGKVLYPDMPYSDPIRSPLIYSIDEKVTLYWEGRGNRTFQGSWHLAHIYHRKYEKTVEDE